MALKPCKECGNPISKSAKVCPQCGYKKKELTTTQALLLCLAFLFLFGWMTASPITPQPPKPPPTEKELASERRFQRVVRFGMALKANSREPDSIEWVEILANEDASVACFMYRGRNGFGGVSIEQMAIINDQPKTSSADWNKYCAGQSLYNLIHARRAI